ncbi:MAG TPA: DUF6789 family protein [Ktedonobacterales bacterium]|nr:DUF6789 family protein [Ktedonobacterales bacterium]
MSSDHPGEQNIGYGLLAGTLAATAYVGAMEIDIALSHYPSSDLQLIEGLVRVRGRPSRVPWVGFLGHLANGAGLGAIYALVQRWLPGPAWLRGILFSEGFLLLIWPTTPLLDRFHPLIRQGQLPPFARRIAFCQNLSRHLVFGLVLGESLRLLKRRASAQR